MAKATVMSLATDIALINHRLDKMAKLLKERGFSNEPRINLAHDLILETAKWSDVSVKLGKSNSHTPVIEVEVIQPVYGFVVFHVYKSGKVVVVKLENTCRLECRHSNLLQAISNRADEILLGVD